MDINNMDDHQEDETVTHIDDVGTKTEPDDNSVGSQVEVPDNPSFSAPLRRNSKGQFVKGTGSRGYLGGRPVGAKDKLSVQFLDVMQSVIEEKGTEMMMRLAEENPAAALAIISRSLPQKAMQDAIDGVTDEGNEIQQVTINLVSAPAQRLPDDRTQSQITEQQRGLNSPVERIEHASEDVQEVVATQEDADELAAQAERERQERQAEAIKAHGGLTGRPARREAPDTLDYQDDELI